MVEQKGKGRRFV